MQNRRGVLDLAVFAHGRRLAIALDAGRRYAQSRDCSQREQFTEFLADQHQFRQVFHILSSAWIFNDGDCGGTPSWRIDGPAHLGSRLFDEGCNLADLRSLWDFHRSPSSPLISEALRPPTRACTRGPVVITNANRISSARGASARPT